MHIYQHADFAWAPLPRLGQKLNICWDDLHSENVMARPGEREILVIAGPGYFTNLKGT
jgi:Ser/Thr protein kinase RdoA (MazF antagonist)